MTVKELVEIIEPDTYVYFVRRHKNSGERFDLLSEIGFRKLMCMPYLDLKGIEDSNVLKITSYKHQLQEVPVLEVVCEVN